MSLESAWWEGCLFCLSEEGEVILLVQLQTGNKPKIEPKSNFLLLHLEVIIWSLECSTGSNRTGPTAISRKLELYEQIRSENSTLHHHHSWLVFLLLSFPLPPWDREVPSDISHKGRVFPGKTPLLGAAGFWSHVLWWLSNHGIREQCRGVCGRQHTFSSCRQELVFLHFL